MLQGKLSLEAEKIPAERKEELRAKATRQIDPMIEVQEESFKNPSAEQVAAGAKPLTTEEIKAVREQLIEREYQTLLNREAAKTLSAAELSGADAKAWAIYNEAFDPTGKWFNISDSHRDMITRELVINVPLIMVSGGVASLARTGVTGIIRAGATRYVSKKLAIAGIEQVGKEVLLNTGSRLLTGNVAKRLAIGGIGLLTEGTVFEATHLGLQGEKLWEQPDWAQRIFWSCATLGLIHEGAKLGEATFRKVAVDGGKAAFSAEELAKISDHATREAASKARIGQTFVAQNTKLGGLTAKISNPQVRSLTEYLLLKGHAEAAAMMIAGAAQQGCINGGLNFSDFIEALPEDLLHTYLTLGGLKAGHAVAGIAAKPFTAAKPNTENASLSPEGTREGIDRPRLIPIAPARAETQQASSLVGGLTTGVDGLSKLMFPGASEGPKAQPSESVLPSLAQTGQYVAPRELRKPEAEGDGRLKGKKVPDSSGLSRHQVVGKLQSGQEVLYACNTPVTPEFVKILPEILSRIEGLKVPFAEIEVKFDKPIGESVCVKTSPDDVIIYARRPRMPGLSRFVFGSRPDQSSVATVFLKSADPKSTNSVAIVGGFIGPKGEHEPWDPRARERSVEYWNNNAFIFGSLPIEPGTAISAGGKKKIGKLAESWCNELVSTSNPGDIKNGRAEDIGATLINLIRNDPDFKELPQLKIGEASLLFMEKVVQMLEQRDNTTMNNRSVENQLVERSYYDNLCASLFSNPLIVNNLALPDLLFLSSRINRLVGATESVLLPAMSEVCISKLKNSDPNVVYDVLARARKSDVEDVLALLDGLPQLAVWLSSNDSQNLGILKKIFDIANLMANSRMATVLSPQAKETLNYLMSTYKEIENHQGKFLTEEKIEAARIRYYGRSKPQDILKSFEIANSPTEVPFQPKDPRNLSSLIRTVADERVMEDIGKELNLNISELSLGDQIHLVRYLAAREFYEFRRLKDIFASCRDNSERTVIAKAFFGACEDVKLGDTILKIAESDKVNAEAKGKIFRKYNELVSGINEIESYLNRNYFNQATPEDINAIRQGIISRANRLLEKYSQRLESSETSPTDAESLVNSFNRLAKENMLYAMTYKQAKSFDEVKDTRIFSVTAEELTPEQREQIKGLSENHIFGNYKEKGYRGLLQAQYEALENSPNTEFFILEHKGRVVGVVRHTKIANNLYYGGGYVLTEEAQNNGLGVKFNQRVLEQEGKENTILAACREGITSFHEENFGFKKAGETEDYLGTGHKVDWIVREAENTENAIDLQTGMNLTKEFLEALYREAGAI